MANKLGVFQLENMS